MREQQFLTSSRHILSSKWNWNGFRFYPIGSTQPPNINFTAFGLANYFHKMAATARSSGVAREELITDDPVSGIMIQYPGLPKRRAIFGMKRGFFVVFFMRWLLYSAVSHRPQNSFFVCLEIWERKII